MLQPLAFYRGILPDLAADEKYTGTCRIYFRGCKAPMDITSYRMRVSHDGEIIEDEFIYGMVTNSLSVGGFKGISVPTYCLMTAF